MQKDYKGKDNYSSVAKVINIRTSQIKTKIQYLNLLSRAAIQICNADYSTYRKAMIAVLNANNLEKPAKKVNESALICDLI